jgi:hypothetical protein
MGGGNQPPSFGSKLPAARSPRLKDRVRDSTFIGLAGDARRPGNFSEISRRLQRPAG